MSNTTNLASVKEVSPNIQEMIDNPPDGSVYMQITPQIAAQMLEFNDRNRPLGERKAEEYARQMAAGKWEYTRVPIIFSDAGRLIDGQHRLRGIVLSGSIVEADIAFGAPDRAFSFIDIGKKRTAGDIFSINGVKEAAVTAAATMWVYRYTKNSMSDGGKKLSIADLYDFYLSHTGIQDSLSVGRKFKKNRISRPSLMVALHYICSGKNRAMADEFFGILGDGIGAKGKFEPALVVRNKMIEALSSGEKLGATKAAALTVAAWNQYRAGLSGRGLRYDPSAAFPRVR